MSVSVNETIQSVEGSNLKRRDSWTEKLEDFAGLSQNGCKWTRESFEQDLRDLRQQINSVDDRIGEIEKAIDDKEKQIISRLESYDQISEAGLEELESKSLADGSNPTHGVNKEKVFGSDWPTEDNTVADDSLIGLYRKKSVLQEIKSTLRRIGLAKVEELGKGYKRDFVSGEVAETVQEDVSDRLQNEADKLELQMDNKLNTSIADIESKIKVVNSRLNQIEKNLDFSTTSVEDAAVDLSSNASSVSEEPEITETEKDVPEYALQGKDVEMQREVLSDMAENEELLMMDISDVANKTDVDVSGLRSILDSVEDKYSTRFGIE